MNDKAIMIHRPTVDLMAADSQTEIKAMAYKLVKFGAVKTNDDAVALAVYSWMTDLNPYNQECYWMPGVGPTPGVQGYRRKAKEYNRVMGGDDDWDYKVSYRLAQPHEAEFNPDQGDVAWVCELTDTKAEKEWQDVYVRFFNLATEAQAPYKEANELATRMAGERPVWVAVGVVKATEHFSKQEWDNNKPKVDEQGAPVYKPEMWDRNERAKKRAEKGALKKRYPDLLIPEFSDVYDSNVSVVVRDVTHAIDEDEEIKANRTPQQKYADARQAAADLGLEPDEIVGEFRDAEEADPLWNPDEHGVSVYETVTDSKGKYYKDKDARALGYTYTALNKKIKELGEPTNEAELSQLEELMLKRDAALYYRDLLNQEATNG